MQRTLREVRQKAILLSGSTPGRENNKGPNAWPGRATARRPVWLEHKGKW